MFESTYWKDDLLKLANKLEMRLVQKTWRSRSFFTIEKEIFLGFFSMRKLIELRKVSDSVRMKNYQAYEFPKNNLDKVSLIDKPESEFNFDNAQKVSLSIIEICNQFIHSYYFLPFLPNGSLIGFFICSDYKRKTGIYFISLFDIVEMYRLVGNNYPSKIIKQKKGN